MAITVRKDMLLGTYSWEAVGGDDPQAIRIDATLFNRREGYEIIPMIQKVVNHFGFETEADVQRVEDLINSELPVNIRGKKNVLNWLIQRLS
jgi:hypothetical protein